MTDPPTARCARAREWASLGLDRELSEFERALMSAHLASCASCHRFEEDVRALTELLRGTPAEVPGREVTLPLRVRVPLRAARLHVRQLASAAALVLAAVGLGGMFLSPPSDASRSGHQLVAASLAGAPAAGNWNELVLDLRRQDLRLGRQQMLPELDTDTLGRLKPPRPALPV